VPGQEQIGSDLDLPLPLLFRHRWSLGEADWDAVSAGMTGPARSHCANWVSAHGSWPDG
jgi:hypothetical protein